VSLQQNCGISCKSLVFGRKNDARTQEFTGVQTFPGKEDFSSMEEREGEERS
jgi:hypothetical protein